MSRDTLYLNCSTCGEAFDDLDIAANHECEEADLDPSYTITLEL